MLRSLKLIVGLLLVSGFVVGCQGKSTPPAIASSVHDDQDGHHPSDGDQDTDKEKIIAKEAKISAVLIKLSPEDRALAESQKYCAVMVKERLGAMGAPLKIDIKGTPVFVCCKGCEKKALKNPDETLEKVAAMKAKNETATP
jgi:hypothetical protein